MIDLGHHGPAYTWSNKKEGPACVSERLDRALANLEWTMRYPATAMYHLPRFNSDHLPILMRTKGRRRKVKKEFRCENWWTLCPDFRQVCDRAMEGTGASWEGMKVNFKKEVSSWEGNKKNT